MGEFGWAYVAGGAITGALGPTGSVLLKIGNLEISGSSNLIYNTNSDTLEIIGNLSASNALTASNLYLPSLSSGTATSSSYLALDSNNIVILTSSVGTGGGSISVQQTGSSAISNVTTIVFTGSTVTNNGSGEVVITPVIGSAEDGSYSDGLFTDFNYNTKIGIAIDKINEVLKGVAPGPSPSLDDIDCDTSGVNAKLSFGSAQSISGYTNALPTSLSASNNLGNADINESFSSTTISNDTRIGCLNGTTVVAGTLNEDVSADSPNYGANSFGSGDAGTLKLFVNNNSTEIHSVDLSAFSSGSSINNEGSGFTLSAAFPGHFSDGSEFNTFKHRTGSYTIATGSQRNGWNYARVTHTVGSSTTTTNYIEWVNDTNANALTSDNSAMDTLVMGGNTNLSGIKYHRSGSAQYRVRVQNAYRNIYSTSNITFTGTNCSIPAQAFPSINNGGGEDESKILHLTGSATITTDPMLNAAITASVNVPAPIKSNISNGSPQGIPGILMYNLSNTSTVTSETFRAENYRLISGSYPTQAAVTSSSNTWDSTTSLLTVDGLLFYNSRLYAPKLGGVSGDFRNTTDGGSIQNGPSSNLNYSGINSGIRTFYRYFQNNSGGSKTGFTITINGSGTIVSSGTSLSTSNIHVFLKLPTTTNSFETGWMDLATSFSTNQTADNDGCLEGSLDSSLNATNTATFGVESIGSNEYIMIKLEALATWTGYINQISISWS